MDKRGSVLIAVLWTLFFLGMLAVALQAYVMPYAGFSQKMIDRTQRRSLAQAGVERAIFEIEQDKTDGYDSFFDPWSHNDDTFKTVSVGNGTFSVLKGTRLQGSSPVFGLSDEESRINVNKAPLFMISNLIQGAGSLNGEVAETVAGYILDWRDDDDIGVNGGKENDDYESAERPYPCKNGDLEVIEELLLVKGVTPGLFKKILPYITVYGEGQVNINTAEMPVLISLGLDESLARKIVAFRSGADHPKDLKAPESVFTEAASIPELLAKEQQLTGDEVAQLQKSAPWLGVRSDHFRGIVQGASRFEAQNQSTVFIYDRAAKVLKYWRES